MSHIEEGSTEWRLALHIKAYCDGCIILPPSLYTEVLEDYPNLKPYIKEYDKL